MATYVLVPGAASDPWYWHRVVPLLRAAGHDVVTPDLPCADDDAGFEEYADVAVEAIGERRDLIVVGQSMGAYTGLLVCERLPVDLLVLVCPMIPRPGETGGAWWENTGQEQAQRESDERAGRPVGGPFDPLVTFLHDVPPEIVAESAGHVREQSGTPFVRPYPLKGWPDVPTVVLAGRDDRLFPAGFMRRVSRERLGIEPEELPSGHLPALACPTALVAALERARERHVPGPDAPGHRGR